MLRYISRGVLNKEIKGLQVWGGDTTEHFSVKSAYECLAG